MDELNNRINKLRKLLENAKPASCAQCSLLSIENDKNVYCSIDPGDLFESTRNYEFYRSNGVSYRCPLIEKDSEDYKRLSEELKLFVELKASIDKLEIIEKITRDAFNNPDTCDLDLYRAQALAKILAVFEQGYGLTDKETENE